ncbi:GntR family transcriptional regulator [Streptomyces sp. NPDC047706]|uniref:GntR family transcriptional regulator n=1 Tax=Streptomyces sp. NPDC047706 TaxID=3365486 RepID=UPI00371F7B7B
MQIVQQTKQAMRLGLLAPGDRLPTAREVVGMTAINPNTVHKAYRELEHEGLVESRRGAGTFVTRSLSRPETSGDSALRTGLLQWLRRAHAAGVGRDDVAALFTDLIADYDALPAEGHTADSREGPTPCETDIEEV